MNITDWIAVLERCFLPDIDAMAGYLSEERPVLRHKDSFLDVFIWIRRHPKHETFHLESAAVYPGSTTDMNDLSAKTNAHLWRHRDAATACLARALNRSGIPSAPIPGGIELGNGRFLAVDGYWFVFRSNYYRRAADPELRSLLESEILFSARVLLVACALARWVGATLPDDSQLEEAEPWSRPVTFTSDPRVSRYRDERTTILMRSLSEGEQVFFRQAQHLVLDPKNPPAPNRNRPPAPGLGRTLH